MNKKLNFERIKQYDKYIINITEKDYKKMNYCIKKLKLKYNSAIEKLYCLEEKNTNKYDFNSQKNFINKQKEIIVNIIKEVLTIYKCELNNLEVVFLSGSFARGTNKMSSDLDLHFFYKNDCYNYIYEEIVSYVITKIINKSRDSIDQAFIFNMQIDNKEMITKKMNKNKLNVILKCKNKEIKYSYKHGKKRRFYLQYTNTRCINRLFYSLNKQLIEHNDEWCHCFEIIKGKKIFNKLYDKLYAKELKLLNSKYIYDKIILLKEKINNISFNNTNNYICNYKNNYQSKTFEWIYKYVSIIRFILISENQSIKYLNLINIYNLAQKNPKINTKIFKDIYKYMWNVEKLTVYCHKNNINYGLHSNEIINYSTEELDDNIAKLKKIILKDLERIQNLYEQSNFNIAHDACRRQ